MMDDEFMTEEDRSREYLRQHPSHVQLCGGDGGAVLLPAKS